MVAAVGESDRALSATAINVGLRRGDLMVLRWEDVDPAVGVIRVDRSWAIKVGPRSSQRIGRRTVPIGAVLRDHLIQHRLRSGGSEGSSSPADLIFRRR